MTTVTMTKDNFGEVVNSDGLVLIDFWASWCGPCRMFAPVFDRAATQHPDVVFAKVDTEAETEVAAVFRISSIPTLVAIRDRTVIYAQPGALPAAALEDLITQAQRLDMTEAAAGRQS